MHTSVPDTLSFYHGIFVPNSPRVSGSDESIKLPSKLLPDQSSPNGFKSLSSQLLGRNDLTHHEDHTGIKLRDQKFSL